MNKAQLSLQRGVNRLNNLVKITLGPNGHNVIIDRQNGSPLITNDGVTIARQVELRDPHERLGADVIKQASIKTNEEAGDGTTSAIVLATAITNHAYRAMRWGHHPIQIKDELLTAAKKVLEQLPTYTRQVHKYEELAQIATNSCANADDGMMVAKALTKVGAQGLISLEMNKLGTTQLVFANGIKLPIQPTSPYFTDQEYYHAQILVTDGVIKSIKEIVPLLEHARQNHQPIVLLANDYSPEVINALVLNRAKAGLQIVALRTDAAEDCAVITGATLISLRNDLTLETATANHLGHADKIMFQPDHIVILTDEKSPAFEQHIKMLQKQIDTATDDYQKTRLTERVANLTATAGVISVGCPTEAETMEKRLRIEDAIATTKHAMAEGVVPGGGLTYVKLAKHLSFQSSGERILKKSLPAIYHQINRNYHFKPSDCTVEDAAATIRSVIKNAVSAAAILITTGEIISSAT